MTDGAPSLKIGPGALLFFFFFLLLQSLVTRILPAKGHPHRFKDDGL
jgi:hypothetical protein